MHSAMFMVSNSTERCCIHRSNHTLCPNRRKTWTRFLIIITTVPRWSHYHRSQILDTFKAPTYLYAQNQLRRSIPGVWTLLAWMQQKFRCTEGKHLHKYHHSHWSTLLSLVYTVTAASPTTWGERSQLGSFTPSEGSENYSVCQFHCSLTLRTHFSHNLRYILPLLLCMLLQLPLNVQAQIK